MTRAERDIRNGANGFWTASEVAVAFGVSRRTILRWIDGLDDGLKSLVRHVGGKGAVSMPLRVINNMEWEHCKRCDRGKL